MPRTYYTLPLNDTYMYGTYFDLHRGVFSVLNDLDNDMNSSLLEIESSNLFKTTIFERQVVFEFVQFRVNLGLLVGLKKMDALLIL